MAKQSTTITPPTTSTTTTTTTATTTKPTKTANKDTLKYVSLITLTLQNAILGLSMRHGRTRGDKESLFFSSTGKFDRAHSKLLHHS